MLPERIKKLHYFDRLEVIPEVLIGLVVLAVVGLTLVGLVALVAHFGVKVLWATLIFLGICPIAFVVGHIVRWCDTYHNCPGCAKMLDNVFMEYFHKRKCLPYLIRMKQ